MKKLVLTTLALIGLISSAAQAYDIDTHFYGTYAMARFAGIDHEYASKIAASTQWMDESYISDPLSMIILPVTGVKKRRLLHFPATRIASEISKNTIPTEFQTLIDPTSKLPLKEFTETEANHLFASEMLNEGLMEGNLMKAAVGLHTLEDSYAHAGTISELGHAHFWHHPDRPFADEASVEKYFQMTEVVFQALVAMRELIPHNHLNLQYKHKPDQTVANYQLDAKTLAEEYKNLDIVQKTVSKKILNDPKYVNVALDLAFARAYDKGILLDQSYKSHIRNYSENSDTYQATESIVKGLNKKTINLSKVFQTNQNVPESELSNFILSLGGEASIAKTMINNLLGGLVPKPLDIYHRFEKEEDGVLWFHELDLRVANMRTLILSLFQEDVYFQKNQTVGFEGFIKEMTQTNAEPIFPDSYATSKIKYISFSAQEKNYFDKLIFAFLFPKTFESIKENMPLLVDILKQTDSKLKTNMSFFASFNKASEIIKHPISTIKDVATGLKLAYEDLWTARIKPNYKNKYYQSEELFKKQKEAADYNELIWLKPLE